MPTLEQLALEYPRLRRAALAAVATALVAFIVATHEGDWGQQDVASIVIAAAAGAAAAAASARADAAIFQASPRRARRWARSAATAGPLLGVVAAFALARSGSVGVVTLVASFLLGFLVPAMFLYPLRPLRRARGRETGSV